MRAAVSTRYGPPEVVRVTETDPPEPAADEVLVRVRATTVNRTDCAYRAARPFFVRSFTGLRRPRRTILGTEFAGDVVRVGDDVAGVTVDERVFGYVEGRFGAHADLVAVPWADSVATIPDGVGYDVAAAATEGAHYARSIIRRAGVRAGDRVLVNGATGGIGSAAVQLLKAHGATVTGVCFGQHMDLVRGLGADQVVDASVADFSRGPQRYDVVVDAVGKSSFGDCRRILGDRGVYVSTELGPGWQNLPLAVVTPPFRRRRVVFPFPEEGKHVVEEIREHLVSGAFRPLIDRTYPLEDIVEAYRFVETGQKVGNVVLTLDM